MSAHTTVSTTTASSGATALQSKAAAVVRWISLAGLLLCVAQVGFAADGFWNGYLGGGTEEATRKAFEMHGLNGQVLGSLAVIMLIAGLVSRINRKVWIIPLVLSLMLWLVQGLLVGLAFGVSTAFGFVHAVSGMIITGLFAWLFVDLSRHTSS